MYRKLPHHRRMRLHGMTLYVPEPGYVYNVMSGKVEYAGVYARSAKEEEQYWEAPHFDYEKIEGWMREEVNVRKSNPEYLHPKLHALRQREWYRRLNGFWFMNKGKPTYITGQHYFYLAHYHLDVGRPKYRETDRLYVFYPWQYVLTSPATLGLILLTKRRYGKTYIGTSIALEMATRIPRAKCGIQSKTESDARSVYTKGVQSAFRRLIPFFRPRMKTMNTRDISRKLEFASSIITDESLDSSVEYRNSSTSAFDGEKLYYYFGDELGKTQTGSVQERHDVVRFCMTDEEGKVIGKAFYATTVEDFRDGYTVEEFRQLVDNSEQEMVPAGAPTPSGMYNVFLPSYLTIGIDKYGMPDEYKGRKYYMDMRKAYLDKGDYRGYLAIVRKGPFTKEEAFVTMSSSPVYNSVKLNKQREFVNAYKKFFVQRGNFHRTESGDVVFLPSANGRWEILKDYVEKDKMKKVNFSPNNIEKLGNRIMPGNADIFGITVDPFDHNRTRFHGASNGSISVFRKFDARMPENKVDMFVCCYVARPQTSYEFYEDVLMTAHYFGAPFLFEDQKPGIENYAIANGYGHMLVHLPGRKGPGISTNKKVIAQYVSLTEAYVDECAHKIYFIDILEDWIQFNPDKTTKFDAGVAASLNLILCNDRRIFGRGTWSSKNTSMRGRAQLDVSDVFF